MKSPHYEIRFGFTPANADADGDMRYEAWVAGDPITHSHASSFIEAAEDVAKILAARYDQLKGA
jgi:hypothetical protein